MTPLELLGIIAAGTFVGWLPYLAWFERGRRTRCHPPITGASSQMSASIFAPPAIPPAPSAEPHKNPATFR